MDLISASVDQRSSSEAKIALFRSLFRGREDVYCAEVRKSQDRQVWIRARLRQRVGAWRVREAAHQMR
jgi:hypothetical protein